MKPNYQRAIPDLSPIAFKVPFAQEKIGAGDGNRTRVASLEDWNSTIELRPQRFQYYRTPSPCQFAPAALCSPLVVQGYPVPARCAGFSPSPPPEALALSNPVRISSTPHEF